LYISNEFQANTGVLVTRDYWPTEEWLYSTPGAQNMSLSILNQMMNHINEEEYNFHTIIIVRNGYIVLEENNFSSVKKYYPDGPHILYSVTKSITSSLIGIAIDKGYITNTSQRIIDFFPNRTILNLDPRKERMNLEHLLTMSAGMYWEGPDDLEHTWGEVVQSGNPVEAILNQPMQYEPGTVWYYNGGCSHLLSAILTEVTGNSTLDFAQEHLFSPLGITSVSWPIDPQGIYFGGQDIWLSPLDMARFGYLYLNNGTWDGTQIVSKDWVLNSTRSLFEGLYMYNYGYGYQWWTAPSLNAYFAWGNYEQKIVVLPEDDLVVIFTARLDDYRVEHELLENYIIPAVASGSDLTESTSDTTTTTSTTTNLNENTSRFSSLSLIIGISFLTILFYSRRKRD
jgi:CubicO group peptidase (beta-lactamase class C family)